MRARSRATIAHEAQIPADNSEDISGRTGQGDARSEYQSGVPRIEGTRHADMSGDSISGGSLSGNAVSGDVGRGPGVQPGAGTRPKRGRPEGDDGEEAPPHVSQRLDDVPEDRLDTPGEHMDSDIRPSAENEMESRDGPSDVLAIGADDFGDIGAFTGVLREDAMRLRLLEVTSEEFTLDKTLIPVNCSSDGIKTTAGINLDIVPIAEN